MERQQIEPICQEMRTYGYEPVVRLHPLYGTLDLVLLRDPKNNKERNIVENLVERLPFRALIDCDPKRRSILQRAYQVKGYSVWELDDHLADAVKQTIDEYDEEFRYLSGREQVFCAKARVAAINVEPHNEGVILAIVEDDMLIPRVYEAICPSAIVSKMVYTPGLVAFNVFALPKESDTSLQKARRAEDVPELRKSAEELEKRRRGTA